MEQKKHENKSLENNLFYRKEDNMDYNVDRLYDNLIRLSEMTPYSGSQPTSKKMLDYQKSKQVAYALGLKTNSMTEKLYDTLQRNNIVDFYRAYSSNVANKLKKKLTSLDSKISEYSLQLCNGRKFDPDMYEAQKTLYIIQHFSDKKFVEYDDVESNQSLSYNLAKQKHLLNKIHTDRNEKSNAHQLNHQKTADNYTLMNRIMAGDLTPVDGSKNTNAINALLSENESVYAQGKELVDGFDDYRKSVEHQEGIVKMYLQKFNEMNNLINNLKNSAVKINSVLALANAYLS